MTAFLIAVGALLLVTTPNHPAAPADPMLHPAVHVVIGAACLLAGACLLGRHIVRGDQ